MKNILAVLCMLIMQNLHPRRHFFHTELIIWEQCLLLLDYINICCKERVNTKLTFWDLSGDIQIRKLSRINFLHENAMSASFVGPIPPIRKCLMQAIKE